MSRPSIEEFKRKLAELDHEITLSTSMGPDNSTCALCRPVERRLNEITEARGRDSFAGARDSSNNIHEHLYNVVSNAGTNYVSVGDIKSALLRLSEEASTNADSPEESDDDDNGCIEERGWTLQELICSGRLLYFMPERTYYSCGAGSWSEDFPLDPAMPAEIYQQYFRDDDPKGISFSGKEDASDCYTTMVEKLSIRQFTKSEDVLKALSGMYSMFARNKLGPAASGVPINFLEASLMWQPAGRLRRRIASPPYPTWSWAGWTGPVTYAFYRIENLDLQPVVQWYLYMGISNGATSQYAFADMTDLVAKPIPSTKRTCLSLQPPELPSPLAFGKRTIPKLDLVKQPVSSTAAILDHAILLCHTRTYTVPIKRISGPELPTRAGLCYFSAIDGESNTVGEFKLDTGTLHTLIGTKQPVAAEVLPIADLDFSSRTLKDLLWMSRHSRVGQFSEAFMEVAEKDPNISIVLWIDRQDGLSRRVALGYITSSSLSRSAGRDDWVILG
ncbi:hypothetical protein DL771_007450 [Monosporascus sp. 5C6A]|nr:hypothetical protein DL771_007450 [Monosporascus sp. 5C6A]